MFSSAFMSASPPDGNISYLYQSKRRSLMCASIAIQDGRALTKGVEERDVHRSFFDYASIGKQKLFSEHPVCQRLLSTLPALSLRA
jgi:hypothetical protein